MWIKEKPREWIKKRKIETSAELTGISNDFSFRMNCAHRWFNIGVKYSEMCAYLESFSNARLLIIQKAHECSSRSEVPKAFYSQNKKCISTLLNIASSLQFEGENLLIFLEGYESTDYATDFISGKLPYRYLDKHIDQLNFKSFIHEVTELEQSVSTLLSGVDNWLSKGGEFQVDFFQSFMDLKAIDPTGSIFDQVQTGANLVSSGFKMIGLFQLVRSIEFTLRCLCKKIPEFSEHSEKNFYGLVKVLSSETNNELPPVLDKMACKTLDSLREIRNAIGHWDVGKAIDGDFIYSCSPEYSVMAIKFIKHIAQWTTTKDGKSYLCIEN